MKLTLGRSGWLALVAALVTLAPVGAASAATYTWVGPGNGNWFQSALTQNLSTFWQPSGGSLGSTTEDVVFNDAGGGFATLNNSASIVNLTFAAGNNTNIAGGLTLTVKGNITNNSGNQAVIGGTNGTLALSPDSAPTTINTGVGSIVINRVLSGGNTILKTGSGELIVNGDANAFNSVLTAQSGSLTVGAGAGQFSGSIVSGASGATILSSVTGSVSFTAGNNTAAASGKTIGSLSSTGGVLTIGSGTVLGTTLLKDTTSTTGGASPTFQGAVTVDGGTNTTILTGAIVSSDLTLVSGSLIAGTNIAPLTVGGSFSQTGGVVSGIGSVVGTVTTTSGSATFGSPLYQPFTSGSMSLGGRTAFNVGSSGSATVSGLTLGGGSDLHLTFQNAPGVNQNINVGGGVLNYGGQLSLDLTTGGTSANGANWQFFNNFSSTSGSFSGVAINTLVGGSYAALNGDPFFLASNATNKFDYRYGDGVWLSNWTNGQRFIFNQNTGILTVVPEPSTIVFAGIGAAMLGWQTWAGRRRKARMKLIDEHTRKLSEQRGLV